MSPPSSGGSKNVFVRIFQSQLTGGAALIAAALLAIAAANSASYASVYEHFLHAPVGILIGDSAYTLSAAHFINDGLMALFFLMVGLEIKRELIEGELSTRAQALLPAIAAAGGMIAPALIYAFFNYGDEAALRGWAIPTATDIAFSLGVLSLLGTRVPLSLKVFLTAVAVIDDLGAIAIIAIFYTTDLNVTSLMLALFVIFYLFALNRAGVNVRVPYILGFFVLWALVLQSGVHATLAGVATAFAVPLRNKNNDQQSLLLTLEADLYYLITFVVLPIFAFANAGVDFNQLTWASLANPIPAGIALGLLFGKVIGITAAVWLAVRAGWSPMPRHCNWSAIISIAFLCGIGFTVSLFIGNLAFDDPMLINQVKLGVLFGSSIAGVFGFLMLRYVAFRHKKITDND